MTSIILYLWSEDNTVVFEQSMSFFVPFDISAVLVSRAGLVA
jgi:hypothetical protein